MAYRILTTTSSFGKIDPKPIQMLKDSGLEVVINPLCRKLNLEESKELCSEFDGLIAGTEKLNEEVFSSAPRLQYLCRLGAGMDSVDFSAAKKHNIVVDNTPTAHIDGVAELTLGGILSSIRSIATAHNDLIHGHWKKPMGKTLKGKRVGIIGLGRIGKRLVELLSPFGVEIYAYDLTQDNSFASNNKIRYVSLEELARQSDIITLHIPLTTESKNIVNKDFLELVSHSVMIVNASRGGLVDEKALYQFLSANSEASAYLDTFEQEPYSGDLCRLSNCTLTPHIGSYAQEVRLEMEIDAAKRVIKYFNQAG